MLFKRYNRQFADARLLFLLHEILMTQIKRICDLGVSIIVIEHDMGLVMRISDRVVVLDQGRVIASGTPAVVRSNPRVIDAYLGREEDEQDRTGETSVGAA